MKGCSGTAWKFVVTMVFVLVSHACGLPGTGDAPILHAASDGSVNSIIITNKSGASQTGYPIQIGRPFVKGEILHYPQAVLNGTALLTQADVKNRWPDGSVKFAVLSWLIPSLPAGGSATVVFQDQPTGNNTGLTQAQMLDAAYNFDATFTLKNSGVSKTASARTMLQNGHYSVWAGGPVCTTIVLGDHSSSRTYDLGFNSSNPFRPIVIATFWPATHQVWVRFIGENSNNQTVQDMQYDLVLALGQNSPQTVYSKTGLNHYAASRWTKQFWLGGTPTNQINIDHNLAYLRRTSYVPYYDTSLTVSESTLAGAYSNWLSKPKDLYDAGLWVKYMPTTGGRPDIAPVPAWDAQWLFTGDWRARQISLGQAELAAAWPLHYREGDATKKFDQAQTIPAIGKIISVHAWPALWIVDNNGVPYFIKGTRITDNSVFPPTSGGWASDGAHQPDPFTTAYVLTGDPFYLEQAQMWAGTMVHMNIPGSCAWCRPPGTGQIEEQERGEAWIVRNRANTALITPDAAPEKTYFNNMVNDAIAFWEGEHNVTGTAFTNSSLWTFARTVSAGGRQPSPLRFWYIGPSSEAPWQDSYMLIVLGMLRDRGFPVDALITYLSPVLTGQFVDPLYDPHFIAQYYWETANSSGVYYSTWSSLASQAGTNPNAGSLSTVLNGFGTNNYYPELAYAASATTYNEPNGITAWNWLNTHVKMAGFVYDLEWSVMPRSLSSGPAAPDTQPPTVPGNLSVGANSSTQISLAWTASTDNIGVSYYQVLRCQGASCVPASVVSTTASTSYVDAGLSAGTVYGYAVKAVDAAGNSSGLSNVAAGTTQASDTQPPTIPTNLQATPFSSTQINLSWAASTDNVAVVGYRVYRNGVEVSAPGSTSYSDTGLSASTTYSYMVSAQDAAGNSSAQSAPVSAATLAIPAAPATAALTASPLSIVSGQSSVLTWSSSNASSCTGTGFSTGGQTSGTATVAPTSTSAYSVSCGSASASVTVTVGASAAVLMGTAGNDTLDGTSGVQVIDGLGGYNVARILYPAGAYDEFYNVNNNADGTVTVVEVHGSGYTFTLRNIQEIRFQYGRAVFTGTPVLSQNTPPTLSDIPDQAVLANTSISGIPLTVGDAETAVENLTLTASSSNTTLLPNANIVFGGSGANRTVTMTPAGMNTGTATVTITVSDGSLSASESFVVTVSPVEGGSVDMEAPSQPSRLSAYAVSRTQIRLSWTASTDNVGVAYYAVLRCRGRACLPTTQVGTASTNSFQDSGLLRNTVYQYRIQAVDEARNASLPSATAKAKTYR